MKVVVPSTCPLHHLPLNLRPGWWSLVRCTHSHSPDRPASLTLPSALGPSPTPRTLSSSNSLSRPLTVIKSRTRSSAPPTPSRAAFQPSQQKLMNGQPVLGAIHYTDYRILCATEMSIINTKHSGNTNTQPTGRPDKYIHMIQSVKKKRLSHKQLPHPKPSLEAPPTPALYGRETHWSGAFLTGTMRGSQEGEEASWPSTTTSTITYGLPSCGRCGAGWGGAASRLPSSHTL